MKVICTSSLVWAIKIPLSCATQKVWSRRASWKRTSLECIPEINLASPHLTLPSVLQPPGKIFHLVRLSLSIGHTAPYTSPPVLAFPSSPFLLCMQALP